MVTRKHRIALVTVACLVLVAGTAASQQPSRI